MDFVKTEPGEAPIIVESYFAITPEEMFMFWTVPENVMMWFGSKPNSLHAAEIDLKEGGLWRFVKSIDAEKSMGFEGKYLIIEPNRRLVFTWAQYLEYPSNDRTTSPPSRVEITITPTGNGINLRLVHSAIQDEATRLGFAGGWEAAFGTMHSTLTISR